VRLAFESGVREGEAAARQQLEVQLRQMTDQLAHTVADVAACRGDAIRRAEADIVQLSMEIARRVIHRELSMDSSVLGALIRAALEKLASQEVHRVRVHPDQAQAVRRCLEEMGRSTDIEVAGDPTLPPGGAIFESSRGSLDASVETQLQEIERGLVDQLQKRS
jgi:flagellar assembly protein FliH